ncbi:MAG: hypothetical protein IT553_01530 [Sphingomonadaceae bacterium]|nr:hypothetical protein [Sphingomonadaceae bacterium]
MLHWRNIVTATLVAGSLDLLAAVAITLFFQHAIGDMLRYVASGPIPPATGWGVGGAILGAVVHFAIMAIIVVIYDIAASRDQRLARATFFWGAVYGVITFAVMNLLVVPLRFGGWPPSMLTIVSQLFCHIVLVGLPIAYIIARGHRHPA